MKKKLFNITLYVIALTAFLSGTVSAAPYESFTKTEWYSDSAAPDGYFPVASWLGEECGTTAFSEPSDICFDKSGNLYVLDKGNNRIVILDTNMQVIKIIDELLTDRSEPTGFSEPNGIFVSKNDEIFVADAGNMRAVKLDQSGKILERYLKPDDPAYVSEIFKPSRIAIDDKGMVYIISDGVYQGILLFEADGRFNSFFGGAPVEVTAQLLMDRLWKSLLSKKQRAGMMRYLPYEYSSLDIDNEGMIYAALSSSKNNLDQLKKLNHLGNNIFPTTVCYGEKEVIQYKREQLATSFVDVAIDKDNYLFALDYTRSRVYLFDNEGKRLLTFGTTGEQLGTFRNARSVAVFEDAVYVLDGAKGNITSFAPTEYCLLMREATNMYNKGEYAESAELWQQLLAYNNNLEMAYNGMGEAYLKQGDYKLAVESFRKGYDRVRESEAFKQYRNQILRENMAVVMSILLILIMALVFFTNRKFLDYIKLKLKTPKRNR